MNSEEYPGKNPEEKKSEDKNEKKFSDENTSEGKSEDKNVSDENKMEFHETPENIDHNEVNKKIINSEDNFQNDKNLNEDEITGIQNEKIISGETSDQENINNENPDREISDQEEIVAIPRPKRKLRRSNINKIISGVCGGIGEYFHLDPALLRLFFLLTLLVGFYGIILYGILALAIKKAPRTEFDFDIQKIRKIQKENRKALFGSVLILFGMYKLFEKFGIYNTALNTGGEEYLITAVISFLFFILIFEYNNRAKFFRDERKLSLAPKNRISGVCSGLAIYFNIDAAFVRILFVIFTFFSMGIGALVYLIFAMILPDTKQNGFADAE